MDTTEKAWQENRDEFLRKAYSAVRASGEPVPLNEAVDNWEMLSDDSSKQYFWRALGIFRLNDSLEISMDGDQKLLNVDPSISLEELEENVELTPGEKENFRKQARDSYREFEDFQAPAVPLFIPWEHIKRHGYEVFPYEDPEMRGLAARKTTKKNTEETWTGFYNNDRIEEGSTWINQVFRGLEIEDDGEFLSTEDVFTDRNRESYADTIWESEQLKIRQRAFNTWDAAVEAVEEKIPEQLDQYRERWGKEADEFDVLKRELRLMVGDEEYDEENPDYIERIVHDYYDEGLSRYSNILEPFLEDIESTPEEEGDMNYPEATRDSATSEARRERNQAYMSHFLDLVWQMSEERYRE